MISDPTDKGVSLATVAFLWSQRSRFKISNTNKSKECSRAISDLYQGDTDSDRSKCDWLPLSIIAANNKKMKEEIKDVEEGDL